MSINLYVLSINSFLALFIKTLVDKSAVVEGFACRIELNNGLSCRILLHTKLQYDCFVANV